MNNNSRRPIIYLALSNEHEQQSHTVQHAQSVFSVVVFYVALIGVTLFVTTEIAHWTSVSKETCTGRGTIVEQNKYDQVDLSLILKNYKLSKATVFKLNREGKSSSHRP